MGTSRPAPMMDGDLQLAAPTGIALAPRLAKAVVVTVFLGYALVGFVKVLYLPVAVWQIAEALVLMAAMLVLQVRYFSWSATRLSPARASAVLIVQAALAYLPLLQFEQAWLGTPGFLAGAVLLVAPPVLAWTGFAAVVLSMAAVQTAYGGPLVNTVYVTIATLITGLVVYALSRLAALVTAVHAARAEMARLAVVQERLRFARDLHDLLGYNLSAITLKTELASRLIERHPARARDELTEILGIARRALTDVRSVASGYQELSLSEEVVSARSVLTAAEIEVEMKLAFTELPGAVSTALAAVLRESVTNILRHSKAEHCCIAVRQRPDEAEIEIVNDGASAPGRPDESGGNGLLNLMVRVDALGGAMTAGPLAGDEFRLHATLPLAVAARDKPPAEESV